MGTFQSFLGTMVQFRSILSPDSVSKGWFVGQERPAPCMHDLPLRSYLDTCPSIAEAWTVLQCWTYSLTGTLCPLCCLGWMPLQRPGLTKRTEVPWRNRSQSSRKRQARPENPVEWLAYYLLKNNKMGDELTVGWLCMAAEFHTFAQMRHVPFLDTSNQAWWIHAR